MKNILKNNFLKNINLLKKSIVISFMTFGLLSQSFSENIKNGIYQTEAYTLNVTYNEELVPGDAIFVRLSVTTPKTHKKIKIEPERHAILRLYQDSKIIEKSDFYALGKQKNPNTYDLLCGVPVSTWAKSDVSYSIEVLYSFSEDENETKSFSLPLIFKERTFISETIDLDDKNTEIKTSNSPERIAQIEKLNNILFTTFPTDVFSLKSFNSPTKSTRYTAYFGDRRTYKYSNGKTTTNLHYGNDYGVPEGTEVLSCAQGKVVMAENRISTGYSVVIEHLPGLYSLYYHLSELNVKEGDLINEQVLIGKSGSTGLATGPHLHWEVRLNGAAVRPEFFLENFTFEPQVQEK